MCDVCTLAGSFTWYALNLKTFFKPIEITGPIFFFSFFLPTLSLNMRKRETERMLRKTQSVTADTVDITGVDSRNDFNRAIMVGYRSFPTH